MLFLPPELEFRFAFFCHFFVALSSLRRDFDIRAHARVLTSYYSGIPSRSARLRTRFASIMRNVYPTNGVPIPCRKRTRTGSRGARKKRGKRKKRHGLSSYRRRIELRFLSNSWGQDESKERRQPEMNINDYPCRRFAFMEMIGHRYCGISNLLVVCIVRLEFLFKEIWNIGFRVLDDTTILSEYTIEFFVWESLAFRAKQRYLK